MRIQEILYQQISYSRDHINISFFPSKSIGNQICFLHVFTEYKEGYSKLHNNWDNRVQNYMYEKSFSLSYEEVQILQFPSLFSSKYTFSQLNSPPRIWAHVRGRYWSAKIDDISFSPPSRYRRQQFRDNVHLSGELIYMCDQIYLLHWQNKSYRFREKIDPIMADI